MLLAKRIKAIREKSGFTQRQIMERIGVEQSTYSGYETEAGNLKFLTIIKLAEALQCSVPFLTDIYSTMVDANDWVNAFKNR
jgi:transcriptional regulator with XRE-family HTH domain